MRSLILTFFFIAGPNVHADVLEPTLPSPFLVGSITSDFGPRNVTTGTPFHESIDYGQARGTLIPPVEPATITDIDFNEGGYGWRMYAQNALGRERRYGHMFEDPGTVPQYSQEFELRFVSGDDADGDSINRYVLIHWQNRAEHRAFGALTSRAKSFQLYDGAIPVTSGDGENLWTDNQLSDFVGPVGNSGASSGPHLDLGLNRGNLNPFAYVIHEPPVSEFSMSFVAPLNQGVVYHYRSGTINKEQLNVEINTQTGLDLDMVEYYASPASQGVIIDEAHRLARFSYAGRWGRGDRLNSAVLISALNATGINPIAGAAGRDRFTYWDWNSQANSSESGLALINSQAKWPDGSYNLGVKTTDVNGHVVNSGSDSGENINFKIDNFRPYLERVEIIKSNSGTKYTHEWTFDGSNLNTTSPNSSPVLLEDGDYTIKFQFSEEVLNPTLYVDGTNGAVPLPNPAPTESPNSFSSNFSVGGLSQI